MADLSVDKKKFDKLLRHMIATKPVTFKELVKKPKRKVKPDDSQK